MCRLIVVITIVVAAVSGCSPEGPPRARPVKESRTAPRNRGRGHVPPTRAEPPPAPQQLADSPDFTVDGIWFVRVPEGYFIMGSPQDEPWRGPDEQQRFVEIYDSFYMSTTEITQQQFSTVMGISQGGFADGQLPVTGVTWDEAVMFCERLTQQHPTYRFRLPNEEEWEYTCRAGSTLAFGTPLGKEEDLKEAYDKYLAGDEDFLSRFVARTACLNQPYPRPVGSMLPNAWGLHDMHGNVWEWCAVTDTGSRDLRALRGGAWSSPSIWACRAAIRAEEGRSTRKDSIGLRVVAEPL